MRKLKLGKKGLSPLVAVIVLLTLVMVLGAIIAGTLSGAPRPVLPATTAVNLANQYGANPVAGDTTLIIRHEYGSVISDAIVLDPMSPGILYNPMLTPDVLAEYTHWNEMELKINGEPISAALFRLTSNSELKVNFLDPDFNFATDFTIIPTIRVWNEGAMDFATGDLMVIALVDPNATSPLEAIRPLESGDLIQLIYVPRDLMLVEYLVQ